ncbi:MAG TPA: amino acid ABC transporter substrate-binding protein, partial [Lachnospiraceae bacterium]|nr:amino acid ABC transporter substrate-binding protein [Lachnospiraceae bacterium]
ATPADGISGICDKMTGAMTTISVDGLTGTGMTWAATGEVAKEPKAMVIVNGEYTNLQ